MEKYCLGIDVDKKSLKVCMMHSTLSGMKIKGSRTFTNNTSGFQLLLEWADKKSSSASFSAVMEATGVYHEHLAYFLNSRQIEVHVVLASMSKYYIRSLGHRSKTDQLDAKGLAQMGCERQLAVWAPAPKSIIELRSLTRQVEALQEQKTMISNQFEAFSHAQVVHKSVIQSNRAILLALEKQIANLKKTIEQIIKNDAELTAKYQLFSTLKGVGMMVFAVVISETNGFLAFTNQKQLTSYAGYDVVENQSGQRSGKTKISKKGNTHIRRILHLAAWTAVSHQVSPFHQLYQRVFERTNIKSKAYVAVQRKLLMMIYTLWKKNEAFDANFGKSQNVNSEMQECLVSLEKKQKTVTSMEATALDKLSCNQVA